MSDTALKEITASMDENENIFRYCLEADRHVSFLTALEEEDVERQHSFLERECSRDLGGSHLAFGTYESPNCFGIENFSSGFEYEEMTSDQGIQNSGEVHRPLNSVDFGASSGENEGRCLSISGMESCVVLPCSPKFSPDSEAKVFKKIKESVSDSSANFSPEGSDIGISFHCEEKDFGTVKGKRAHKAPRRYIEETIKAEPRKISKKSGVSCKRPRDRLVDEKFPKPKEEKVDGNTRLALQDGSFDGCIQVPFGLPVEDDNTAKTASYKPLVVDVTAKGHRPTFSTLKRELESPPAKVPIIPKRPSVKAQIFSNSPLPKLHVIIPQEEPVNRSPVQKGIRRRKHHISWTLSEVMRLIEGVSRLGVGRWSKIKRLLFTTSKHRTSADLKDKWRNLVKASAHLRRKKKGLQARKQLSHQAPESMLRRVLELADYRE